MTARPTEELTAEQIARMPKPSDEERAKLLMAALNRAPGIEEEEDLCVTAFRAVRQEATEEALSQKNLQEIAREAEQRGRKEALEWAAKGMDELAKRAVTWWGRPDLQKVLHDSANVVRRGPNPQEESDG